MAEYSPLPKEKSPRIIPPEIEFEKVTITPRTAGVDALVVKDIVGRDRVKIIEGDMGMWGYDAAGVWRFRLMPIDAYDALALQTGMDFRGGLTLTGGDFTIAEKTLRTDVGATRYFILQSHNDTAYVSCGRLMGGKFDMFRIGKLYPMSSGVVSIGAGATYVVGRFTVSTGRTLRIHSVGEMADPDGYIVGEVYNVTDDVSVTGDIDGWDDTGWEVPEGKEVEFRMKNTDTVAAHDGHYAFLISLI